MILEGAPVTGLTFILSPISYAIVRGQISRYRHAAFAAATPQLPHSTLTVLRRLLLESIPTGPLSFSVSDMAMAALLLYQFRTLERRWGSSTYLSFLLSAAALGIAATQLLVTESNTRQLSLDALRILSAVGTLVPLSALFTRYVSEVPSLHVYLQRVPGTGLAVTEKIVVLLPLLKLIFSPATQLEAQTYRRAAVVVDVGMWTRLLCALCGVLFALLSTRSITLRWLLLVFAKYVCKPFLRFLRPLTELLFGASFSADHAKPRHRTAHGGANHYVNTDNMNNNSGVDLHNFQFDRDDGVGGAAVMDDGRYVVESLAGNTALQEVRARMRARRHAQQAASGPRGGGGAAAGGRGGEAASPSTSAAPAAAASSSPAGPLHAARRPPHENAARLSAAMAIEALGLPVGRDEIMAALDMTDGNVELAVQVLLGN